jgi:hypothetical protein
LKRGIVARKCDFVCELQERIPGKSVALWQAVSNSIWIHDLKLAWRCRDAALRKVNISIKVNNCSLFDCTEKVVKQQKIYFNCASNLFIPCETKVLFCILFAIIAYARFAITARHVLQAVSPIAALKFGGIRFFPLESGTASSDPRSGRQACIRIEFVAGSVLSPNKCVCLNGIEQQTCSKENEIN